MNIGYKLKWMKVYFSPFKPPIPKLYIGKLAIGTPYFFPRRWVKNKEKPGYLKAIPKKLGFDFVELGWKTKYDDFRFEWAPIWSFVFFKWQIAITFIAPHQDHFWECWLEYTHRTDSSKSNTKRIEEAKKNNPCIWTVHETGKRKKTVCYWDYILKD